MRLQIKLRKYGYYFHFADVLPSDIIYYYVTERGFKNQIKLIFCCFSK